MVWVVKMDNIFDIDEEKYIKYIELRELCKQLGRFIEDNFPQCTSVVVDADKFVVKGDIIDGYFELTL